MLDASEKHSSQTYLLARQNGKIQTGRLRMHNGAHWREKREFSPVVNQTIRSGFVIHGQCGHAGLYSVGSDTLLCWRRLALNQNAPISVAEQWRAMIGSDTFEYWPLRDYVLVAVDVSSDVIDADHWAWKRLFYPPMGTKNRGSRDAKQSLWIQQDLRIPVNVGPKRNCNQLRL